MRKTLILVAALAMIGAAGAANAQTIDKNGKCHAADGKMAKMEVCKAVKPAKAEQCRDISGKFIKCGGTAAAKPAATPAKATTTATAAKPAATPAKPATPAVPAKKATNTPAKK